MTDARADELQHEAYLARRAARPAWRNDHLDRQAREREARRVAKEYRQANATKVCGQCGEDKPLTDYAPRGNGLRGTCNACRNTARRAKNAPKVAQRQAEREAARELREADKAAEAEALRAAKALEAEAERERAEARRRYNVEYRQGVRRRPLTPDQVRKVNEEVDHLTSLLDGTHPTECISDQKTWEATTSKLRRLWLQSGDKFCASCGATVPPTHLQPPGPANFYPGRCNRCVEKEYAAHHLRVFGRLHEGPRLIPIRDGTAITVAELARRVREREHAYRLARFGA